ncbi:MAG: endopeptidase La [Deltaproteobacteria bacterium]|nr:endopeptidase La [Deltaproteobacteria bacterium]
MDIYDDQVVKIPEEIVLIPVRDLVVFPQTILPLFVGRESSIKAVEEAMKQDKLIILASQKEIADENPTPQRIYKTGTIAMIMRMRKQPDGKLKILVQGMTRAEILDYVQKEPYLKVKVKKIEEMPVKETSGETEALIRTIKENLEQIISLGKALSPDILMVLDEVEDPYRLADLVAANLNLKVEDAQKVLETIDIFERLKKINALLVQELEVLAMQAKIRSQARDEMTKSQKEYFLREQMRAIRGELGEHGSEVDEMEELHAKIEAARMPPPIKKEALKQLTRLERMHPEATEASMVRGYLDWILDVPWGKSTKDNIDIRKAKEILDEDHFDLSKVKERILEFLAVRKLKQRTKGPILCFVGPPGVGKTSLGRSIARAMGRKFVRISLGGIKDEAEIRGHRRTYVGSLPGRIIQGLKQCKSNNPVFMLDEVDKLGSDFRGDPSSALLEVLDPEQNNSFVDLYLNLPCDLSNVMFIATANVMDTIPHALKDRMEVIRIAGYSEEDKIEICKRYLIPKQIEENGLNASNIEFTDSCVHKIISQYTREAGLRNLEREIASICRKVARKCAEGIEKKSVISLQDLPKYLGPARYLREEEQLLDEIGVATGLAWTEVGGETLFVESSKMRGKNILTLTGQLGDVMKESAQAALAYARSHAKQLKFDEKFFDHNEIHVHVPAGAIPKDGPSAGVTMATSIISLLTQKKIRKDIAMTGEITLTGKVLPVGGIKEKVLAAVRQKVKEVIIPEKNKKDIDEIPPEVQKKIRFQFAKTIDDVLQIALLNPKKQALKRHSRLPHLKVHAA